MSGWNKTPPNQVGIGVSSMCAFDLYKDYGLRSTTIPDDDRFFNIAGGYPSGRLGDLFILFGSLYLLFKSEGIRH